MNNISADWLRLKPYQKISAACLLIAAFGLPMFPLLTFISLLLANLAWLFSTPFALVKATMAQSKAAQLSLVLFACICLSGLYSPAPVFLIFKTIVSYREFLLIPLTMCVFGMLGDFKKYMVYVLVAALSWVVLLSSIDVIYPLPFANSTRDGVVGDHYVFRQHIVQNVMSSFLVLLLLIQATDDKVARKWRLFCMGMAVLAIVDILFWVKGRTGILTLALNLGIFAYYRLAAKQKIYLLLVCALFAAIVAITNNPLKKIIAHTEHEVSAYQQTGEDTSAGLRMAYWQYAWGKIEQKPILGYGAGSYRYMYDLHLKNPTQAGYWAGVGHPHNEFLMLWFQSGVLSVLLFVAFILSLLYRAFKTTDIALKIAQCGVVGTLLVYSLLDVPIYIYTEGMFFWFLIGVFFAIQPPHTGWNAK